MQYVTFLHRDNYSQYNFYTKAGAGDGGVGVGGELRRVVVDVGQGQGQGHRVRQSAAVTRLDREGVGL